MEPDARFYRRRAYEELAAAQRAVTPEARDRRVQLARSFLSRLKSDEANDMLFEWGVVDIGQSQGSVRRQSTYA